MTARDIWKRHYRDLRIAISECDEIGCRVNDHFIYNRSATIYFRRLGKFHGRTCMREYELRELG